MPDPKPPADDEPEIAAPKPIDIVEGDAPAETIEETGEPFDSNFA